ncbi:MAG TPA: cupin domain-containing protein [Elusimicrobia bacterium]|nr:cupin domain-containing protein [Elusimicrobiota bacterium]
MLEINKKPVLARWALLLFLASGFGVQSTQCGDNAYNAGVESRQVMRCTQTAIGQDLKYPAAKSPEVTCLEVTVHPGQETGWHTHSVPGYAYIVSGELTLEYPGNISKVFKAGEAFAEVVDTKHNGVNYGKNDVVLVAFFTGDRGVPFTKKLDDKAK